jgi:hypothetical protein
MRSGGSSSKARESSAIVSRPSGVSTSPLRLKAIATSSSRPASRAAERASPTARRTMSIQCTGSEASERRVAPSRRAVGRPQVLVQMTSQPTSI